MLKVESFWKLIKAPDRLERTMALLEIQYNRALYNRRPLAPEVSSYSDYLGSQDGACLREYAEESLEIWERLREHFEDQKEKFCGVLPFPTIFNADSTLARLGYLLTRMLSPRVVVESGVGYGMLSAHILSAIERNNVGELRSLDLPPLSDPKGSFIGFCVAEELRAKWVLTLGGSRRHLFKCVGGCTVDLFISDSANVFSLQRFEFLTILPALRSGGVMLFNNVSARFVEFLQGVETVSYQLIFQEEKKGVVTALIFKH